MYYKFNPVDVCDYICVCFCEIVEAWNNIECGKMLFEFSISSISSLNFFRTNIKPISVKRPFLRLIKEIYKSSLSGVFCRVSVLRSLQKIQKNNCDGDLFKVNLHSYACKFTKTGTLSQGFYYELCEIVQKNYSMEHL